MRAHHALLTPVGVAQRHSAALRALGGLAPVHATLLKQLHDASIIHLRELRPRHHVHRSVSASDATEPSAVEDLRTQGLHWASPSQVWHVIGFLHGDCMAALSRVPTDGRHLSHRSASAAAVPGGSTADASDHSSKRAQRQQRADSACPALSSASLELHAATPAAGVPSNTDPWCSVLCDSIEEGSGLLGLQALVHLSQEYSDRWGQMLRRRSLTLHALHSRAPGSSHHADARSSADVSHDTHLVDTESTFPIASAALAIVRRVAAACHLDGHLQVADATSASVVAAAARHHGHERPFSPLAIAVLRPDFWLLTRASVAYAPMVVAVGLGSAAEGAAVDSSPMLDSPAPPVARASGRSADATLSAAPSVAGATHGAERFLSDPPASVFLDVCALAIMIAEARFSAGGGSSDFAHVANLAVEEAMAEMERVAASESARLMERGGAATSATSDDEFSPPALSDNLAAARAAWVRRMRAKADSSAAFGQEPPVFDALAAFYAWQTRLQGATTARGAEPHGRAAHGRFGRAGGAASSASVLPPARSRADTSDDASALEQRRSRSATVDSTASGTPHSIDVGDDWVAVATDRDDSILHGAASVLGNRTDLVSAPVWSPGGKTLHTKDPAVLRTLPLEVLPHPLVMQLSRILQPWHVALLAAELPQSLQGYEWHCRYSLSEHGASLSTFLGRCGAEPFTLLVMQDEHGTILGGLATEPWVMPSRRPGYFGHGNSFVFTFADRRKWDAYRAYLAAQEAKDDAAAVEFATEHAHFGSDSAAGAAAGGSTSSPATSASSSSSAADATTLADSARSGSVASSADADGAGMAALQTTPAAATGSTAASDAPDPVLTALGLSSPTPATLQLDALAQETGEPPAAALLPGAVAGGVLADAAAPHFSVYRWSRSNAYFQHLSDGVGIGMGGGGHFAWYVDEMLEVGNSGRCETYRSPCLATSDRFKCVLFEAWVFRRRLHFAPTTH